MCGLFGMFDPHNHFSGKQKRTILHALACASEERGTDASGIAYHSFGRIHIQKRPVPGHRLKMRIPGHSRCIIGHTRMTTHGTEDHNYNNHPFLGHAGDTSFALAHNGVLRNACSLQRAHHLLHSPIETDSYTAVQLLEKGNQLDMVALGQLAEELEGSFTITLLDDRENLYIIKGNNPICLYHFPDSGIYLYASTEEILLEAFRRLSCPLGKAVPIPIEEGEIFRLDRHGAITRSHFNMDKLVYGFRWYSPSLSPQDPYSLDSYSSYMTQLRSMAGFFGLCPEDIDVLREEGFAPEEIEEYLYSACY